MSGAVQKPAIRSWFRSELGAALKKYFGSPEQLSGSYYWPRSLRQFLCEVCTSLIDQPDQLEKLSFDSADLVMLKDELRQPTSHYIHASDRKLIHTLLLQLSSSTLNLKVSRQWRLDVTISEHLSWPSDVLEEADLADSISTERLRDDVSDYIFSLLKNTLPAGCPSTFDYSCMDDSTSKPLIIHVPADHVPIITAALARETTKLGRGFKPLTPVDLIGVLPLSKPSFGIKEESTITSGSFFPLPDEDAICTRQ